MELLGDGVPTRGKEYPFAVSGLEPDSPYKLMLEDRVVHTGTLNPDGFDSGSFTFPYDVPTTGPSFLATHDITGEFAFTITSACSDCPCQVGVDKRLWNEQEKKYYWQPCRGLDGVEHTFEWKKDDIEDVSEIKNDLSRPCVVVTLKEGPPCERRCRCTNSDNGRTEVEIVAHHDCYEGTTSRWRVH